jgi:methylmalonyl-CoA/ethylmalonyl-CoA epimerase
MKITNIEHIGIAVKNVKEAINFYENILGLKCYGTEDVEDQKVKTAFFKLGETKIELLETTEPDGPIGKFIGKKGEGIHHIAFTVEDIEQSINEVESQGIKLINNSPYPGAEGFEVVFLHPKSTGGVLIELCGKK